MRKERKEGETIRGEKRKREGREIDGVERGNRREGKEEEKTEKWKPLFFHCSLVLTMHSILIKLVFLLILIPFSLANELFNSS